MPEHGNSNTTSIRQVAVAEFIHRGVVIAKDIAAADGVGKKLVDFKVGLRQ